MFKLVSRYKPGGDQTEAIKELVDGIKSGKKEQVLLGATGTGKTFTIANVIEKVNKPTLVLAHNKTLAGQLYSELKELFPENRVEYFVSYYDYYQPEEYEKNSLTLRVGETIERNDILKKLVDMLYERNDMDLVRGTFRSRGDSIEVVPAYSKTKGYRIDLFGDEIEGLIEFDTLTGKVIEKKKTITIFAASHFVTSEDKLKMACKSIREELNERLIELKKENKLLEYQRLNERTNYDLELLEETGFCKGIENYSRHITFRKEGEAPPTLIDFFPKDFLLVVDESHVTLPQVRAMYNGDRMRKSVLVEYGFRLPSALDNRPLKFDEFNERINQAIYVSATPGDYELERVNNKVVEQIIRPTGLLDPTIEVRKTEGQIDDLIYEIKERIKRNERTLITTLTIRMSEELTNYLKSVDIKVAYLHNEVKTLERLEIVHDLRAGKYDCVVGVNLLREGIDIPEVSLIAILDADKQGFLRSTRSLIQTIGRAARNANGNVIMYADTISDSMDEAIKETNRRRTIQEEYNKEHNIVPKTIIKPIQDIVKNKDKSISDRSSVTMTKKDKDKLIKELEKEMMDAARELDFERATELRDALFELRSQ